MLRIRTHFYPDPAFHFNAGLDSTFHSDADPDSTLKFYPVPDPTTHFLRFALQNSKMTI